jgi:hypothetical protein
MLPLEHPGPDEMESDDLSEGGGANGEISSEKKKKEKKNI